MTTFIKTYSEGMCATFDPHVYVRSADGADGADDAASRYDIEAARIKSWLGIDVLEDHDDPHKYEGSQHPKARSSEEGNINNGDVQGNEASIAEEASTKEQPKKKKYPKDKNRDKQASLKPSTVRAGNSTSTSTGTGAESDTHITSSTAWDPTTSIHVSSIIEVGKHVVVPDEKALTVTAADPTTTASLSPQEYQSRLEKQRYKENLRSVRSVQRRISSEQEAQRALANSRLAAATASDYEKNVEKDVQATATSTAGKTHDRAEKKAPSTSTAKSGALAVVPAQVVLMLAVAIAVAM